MAPFRKKVYRLDRLVSDVAWLVAHAPEAAAVSAGTAVAPAWRERIMVAVARTNDCRYCVYAHQDAARHAGLTDSDLAAPAPDQADALAVEYACALAAVDFGDVDPALEVRVSEVLGEEGRRHVETTARLMTVANLSGNTVDALMSRLTGRPAPGSRAVDEIVVATIWSLGAALTSWNIWRARGGSPLAVLEDFREFARSYGSA